MMEAGQGLATRLPVSLPVSLIARLSLSDGSWAGPGNEASVY